MSDAKKFKAPDAIWSCKVPNSAGFWWLICGEANGDPELVEVIIKRGELWAENCEIGNLPVKMYSEGLTCSLWQKAVPSCGETPYVGR